MSEASTSDVGLLDTSVVIDLQRIARDALPAELAICAITHAELAAGPHAARDRAVAAVRQDRLQRTEAVFDPIPFGLGAARAYGRIAAAVRESGRQPRRRVADLLIAAVALAEDLPLLTRNPADFAGLDNLIEVREVGLADEPTT